MRMSKQGSLQTSQKFIQCTRLINCMDECIDEAGEGEGDGRGGGGVSCLMRGSVWVPVCDGIVIAGLQLDILYTLSFGLMELLFSFIVVLARHISEECILSGLPHTLIFGFGYVTIRRIIGPDVNTRINTHSVNTFLHRNNGNRR